MCRLSICVPKCKSLLDEEYVTHIMTRKQCNAICRGTHLQRIRHRGLDSKQPKICGVRRRFVVPCNPPPGLLIGLRRCAAVGGLRRCRRRQALQGCRDCGAVICCHAVLPEAHDVSRLVCCCAVFPARFAVLLRRRSAAAGRATTACIADARHAAVAGALLRHRVRLRPFKVTPLPILDCVQLRMQQL